MGKELIVPDYLFEVSWEVCNKVGGIHTVISTKAKSLKETIADRHILIGPDLWREAGENPEFEEDPNLFSVWREKAAGEGLRLKIGRWEISGRPIAVILDFTTFMGRKDEILSKLWEAYQLDSMSGQWDYIEPALFGYAAGMVIESFARNLLNSRSKVVAQFHEWMTGGGLLFLNEHAPQIATLFTTHATVMGRSIAGNRLPLYSEMENYDSDIKSNDFNVVSKQSLESLSAQYADAFTTVSAITSRECTHFLKKDVDVVTPNGFEDSFVPAGDEYDKKRTGARNILLKVARSMCRKSVSDDALLVATSGRYEFYNKGIDVFIDALGKLDKEPELNREIIVFILVPAHHYGPRKELMHALENNEQLIDNVSCVTHHLHHPEYDPVLNRIREKGLNGDGHHKVKIIFVPSYLQGNDGIFNLSYYELLIGFDLTIFPSYYEPWGYTPMESLAFKIPSITTTLAGFGLWVNENYGEVNNGITVIERNDQNFEETVDGISATIMRISKLNKDEFSQACNEAWAISRIALWTNFVNYYYKAFDIALKKAARRSNMYVDSDRREFIVDRIIAGPPSWKNFLVKENVPEKLSSLEELSENLHWSWDQEATDLFRSLDPEIWEEVNQNPIMLLKKLSLERFIQLENDKEFITRLERVHENCRNYMAEKENRIGPKVAYFSMEFGLHDSLKIYSGGLGLLAGDYLKEASDYNRNIVGIGLLYRFGYFSQIISAAGDQIVANEPQDFSRIPAKPVRDDSGNWKTISVQVPGRPLKARIWRVDVGRIELYLLDTDFEENIEQDRSITHYLYGGDQENRFKQELLLGIGGIRALNALGIEPDLYHCNEGHSAFIGLERLRQFIADYRFTFQESLEIVRATTLFTTHTPVPAGHDTFEEGLVRMYMAHYPERLNITWDQFIGLGRLHPGDSSERFSMSYLAINLSQEVNGVSKLHGVVTREMFGELWKGYIPSETFIGHVTNGVHVPTWTADNWMNLYKEKFGEDFLLHQADHKRWNKIYKVPDKEIWDLRNTQRSILIGHIKDRIKKAAVGKTENPTILRQVEDKLKDDVLTIGFARRFATYKRAHLLFRDIERLSEILNKPGMPVQVLFAGKAHPKDKAGQDLIKMVVEISKRTEFIGKILFLQDYDINLAKRLVQGVDIWMNTPTRPQEASGTSGEKAVMNGGLHFSVLDGWWAEGYVEGAGWALDEERSYDNQDYQDQLDAETIYSLLEDEIAPLFYNRNKEDVPEGWVQIIKNSIAKVAPNFTMNRMLIDYENKYYNKLFSRSQKINADNYALARDIAQWKKIIVRLWNDIEVISYDHPDISKSTILLGDSYESGIILNLKNISPDDIGVELVIYDRHSDNGWSSTKIWLEEFELVEQENGLSRYKCSFTPSRSGVFEYGIRVFPRNPDLPHRQDFALVKWV